MNNIPVHAPLFPPDLNYGSDDAEGVSILVEVDEKPIRDLLQPTPFEFVSPHAWIEIMTLNSAFGVAPFAGGGVILPARYGDTVGGYYAFCYIDTDEALALGREPFGYPKKCAESQVRRTGQAVTAEMIRKDAHVEVSVVLDDASRDIPSVPRYPHFLLQVLPGAESPEVLLKRVVAWDTNATSRMEVAMGEGAIEIRDTSAGNELAWLKSARALVGSYACGAFRGAYGKVLGTIEVGSELRGVLTRHRTQAAE